MTISIFLTYGDEATGGQPFEAGRITDSLSGIAGDPDLNFIDIYRRAGGEVPEFSEGSGPAMLVELNVSQPEQARNCLHSEPVQIAARAIPGTCAAVDVFEVRHYPVAGQQRPSSARSAALSFVVRYYRPAPDEAAFISFYTEHHPLLLALLPGVRNVLCYLPVAVDLPAGLSGSGAFFGNEVVFDGLASLNRALASDVLPRLRAEGRQFPPYGHSTHHAMQRSRFQA
jgi:hypothetical protein